MKKNVRFLAFLFTLTITLSAFTGCEKNVEKPSDGSSTPQVNDSSNNTPPAEAPTLKWIQIGGQPNDLKLVTEEMNKYSEEKVGAKAEFTYLDWGVWGDRSKVIVNSGEPFDIMFTNTSHFTSSVAMGAFADITDLLNTEGAELKKFIPEKIWPAVTIKGKIYAVPTYKDSSQTQYWVWDKELVDKYNIDYKNIKTVDQLDPVLYLFKDKIAAGEIKDTKYAFPNIKDGINGFLFNYDRPAVIDVLGVRYDDSTAKVVNVLEQEDIMTVLKYMHKWYKDGIINPDAPTLEEASFKWVPVSSGQGFPGADVTWTQGRGKQTISKDWGGPLYSTDTVLGSVNAISASSKYKAEAVKYLQLCNLDPKMRNMLAYGIEGVHYKDNGDGTITRDNVKKDNYGPAAYSQATFFTMSPVAPNSADQWKMVQDWNESATSSILLGFIFDREKVETQIANCTAIQERYKNELYTGASDPEKKVPAYYKELEKAGLNDIREELQKQINDWLGK